MFSRFEESEDFGRNFQFSTFEYSSEKIRRDHPHTIRTIVGKLETVAIICGICLILDTQFQSLEAVSTRNTKSDDNRRKLLRIILIVASLSLRCIPYKETYQFLRMNFCISIIFKNTSWSMYKSVGKYNFLVNFTPRKDSSPADKTLLRKVEVEVLRDLQSGKTRMLPWLLIAMKPATGRAASPSVWHWLT